MRQWAELWRETLAAYQHWGEACPARLLGDFAFAIWDTQQRRLFCARDHMGVRSLYYYCSDKLFALGTEIKALFQLEAVPRRLNEVRIADFLRTDFEDTVSTFYEGIVRLSAAHCMTVTADRLTVRRYWSLDPDREVRYGSEEEYGKVFRTIFTEAVRCRTRSAYPVGAMLSGGLDSSSITCVARPLLAERGATLHTFSAVYDTFPECDERNYMRAVIEQGNVEAHFVHPDMHSALIDFERMLWHQDELFYGPNYFIHWNLWTEAQHHGVRLLLDGFDGDTTVSHGIGWLCELARSGRLMRLSGECWALAQLLGKPYGYFFWHRAVRPVLAAWASPVRQRLRRRGVAFPRPGSILACSFANQVGYEAKKRALDAKPAWSALTERSHHYRRLSSGLMQYIVEVTEKAAAAFSIQPVLPFCDKRLMEYCLALPGDQKLKRGWTRYVMRQALADLLPPRIRERPGKTDMSPLIMKRLRSYDAGRLEAALVRNREVLEPFIDMSRLQDAYGRPVEDDDQGSLIAVWQAMALSVWLRSAGFAAPRAAPQ